MFGKDKNDKKDGPSLNLGQKASQEDARNMSAPPLKPFSKKGTNAPAKPASKSFRPEIPRRVIGIPGAPNRNERVLSLDDDANRLSVGRNIQLSGDITSCDKLVVEGQVEATLTSAHMIEILPTGSFKGTAEVEVANIGGHFEGTLIARDLLSISKDGRVSGSVRYGRIVIESGGEISGDMASLKQPEEGADEEPGSDAASG